MSTKKENTIEELKYVERLNISSLSISKVKNVIKTNINNTIISWKKGQDLEKQTFHIIGPAGIGKTQICNQIADELSSELKTKFEVMLIKCPVLSRDDFLIPFPIVDNGSTSFKMLYSDFVPKKPDSYGIFVIDEFSRGDHTLQQLMWQIQNECKVHLHNFPKGWFIIAIDNPDDQEYSVDTLEDAAGLRRMLHLYVEVNVNDFLLHAVKSKFHSAVIEFIQTNPNFIYDFQAQKIGSVYANPASYEKLSNILWGFENNGGILCHTQEIDILASGLLNVSKTKIFMEFLNGMSIITPMDVFSHYKKVKSKVEGYVNTMDYARLGELMTSVVTYLYTSKPKYKKQELDNMEAFLLDCPVDTAALFITNADKLDRKSDEFKYLTFLHVELMKREGYKKDFYDKLVALQNK
jgi:hypothetical protein